MKTKNYLVTFTFLGAWPCFLTGASGELSAIEESEERDWNYYKKKKKEDTDSSEEDGYFTDYNDTKKGNKRRGGSRVYHRTSLPNQGLGEPLQEDETTKAKHSKKSTSNLHNFVEMLKNSDLDLDDPNSGLQKIDNSSDSSNDSSSDSEDSEEEQEENQVVMNESKTTKDGNWSAKVAVLGICTGAGCFVIIPPSKKKKGAAKLKKKKSIKHKK